MCEKPNVDKNHTHHCAKKWNKKYEVVNHSHPDLRISNTLIILSFPNNSKQRFSQVHSEDRNHTEMYNKGHFSRYSVTRGQNFSCNDRRHSLCLEMNCYQFAAIIRKKRRLIYPDIDEFLYFQRKTAVVLTEYKWWMIPEQMWWYWRNVNDGRCHCMNVNKCHLAILPLSRLSHDSRGTNLL